MGEYHKSTVITSTTEIMWEIYSFIKNVGQTAIRIVSDGGVDAVHNATTFITPASSSDFSPLNSYLVYEPVDVYPGGGRWQVKLIKTTTGNISATFSADGGWTNAGQAFTATTQTSATSVWTGTPTTNTIYMSSSNLETYNAGADNYTYFRFIRDNGASRAFYTGGYVPVDAAADTKPSCMLVGYPTDDSSADRWGYNNTSNASRAPKEYAHSTSITSTGHVCIWGVDLNGIGKNFASTYVGIAPWLRTVGTSYILGYFGPYTMLTVDESKADGDVDGSGSYIKIGAYMHRWVP